MTDPYCFRSDQILFDLRDVTFGLHLIKQFYFAVDSYNERPTASFWKRVDKPLKKNGFLSKIW